jgi:prepilin-type N-terminal cleavage/methylation domain-containing protein
MTSRRDERGFTLVELTVVLLIGSLVTFMMLNFLDNTSAVVGRSSARVQTESDARVALRTVLQDVRAAQSIVTSYPSATACPTGVAYPAGYANCLRFTVVHTTSSASACPNSLITYGLVGTTLKEDRVDYDASCTARTIFTGRTVLNNVTNGSSRPLFIYADQYGNGLNPSTSPAAAFAAAGTITLNIFLQYRPRTPEISLFSAAALRNNR